jgi:hypothetical protein
MTPRPHDDAAACPQCEKCGKAMRDTGFLQPASLPLYQCDVCHATRTFAKPAPMPSDDGEPITQAWWKDEFGALGLYIDHSLSVEPVRIIHDGFIVAGINCQGARSSLRHVKTRGQLRALLAALGWQREEPTDDDES